MIALVFIGESGSGKTTLAKQVAAVTELEYIGSGDIARTIGRADHYAQAGLERGEMAPELAMRQEVLTRIESATLASGDFILDGFPRTVEQLYILESVANVQPLYFVLEVPAIVCFRRLIARKRADDHPDAVATRFRTFQAQTIPMLEVLRDQTIDLDGGAPLGDLVELVVDEYDCAKRESGRAA